MSTARISILICTYNRSEFVRSCLESLTTQTVPREEFEVLVVNNNSSDDTLEVAESFREAFPHFAVYTESRQGLSYARNLAFQKATTKWLCYLDDDARAAPDFVEQALYTIDHTDYLFFGGYYTPWYKYGKPYWYKDAYGSNVMPFTTITTLPKGEYVSGGIMVMRKDLLERYGGFDPDIGMIGNKVGYAEETELQVRLRQEGIPIGINPDFRMDHVVATYKLELDWFFKAAYALGRDRVTSGLTSSHPLNLIGIALTLIVLTSIDALRNSFRLLGSDYYLQNWLIDSFRKAAKRVGMLYTALKLIANDEFINESI